MKSKKNERLEYFRSLYENAKNRQSEERSLLERHMKQYRGDTEIDGSCERASLVRNITYEMIESQVSSDIPAPKVDPASYSERRDRNAKSIERLCASIRDKLPFEEMNDIDERYTYIYGSSIWFVEWDAEIGNGGEIGGVKISCLSPRNFVPQPGILSIEDMDYCFLRFTTSRADLSRTYGIREDQLNGAELDTDTDQSSGEECVTVIVAFYRAENGEIGEFIFSGELTLKDIPNYYSRKRRRCSVCGEFEQTCVCQSPHYRLEDETYETLSSRIVLKDGITIEAFSPATDSEGHLTPEEDGALMCPTVIPYYTPKRFPIVIRKNTSGEDSLFGQSDCEYLRPMQQAINKIESRILQKLLRAGITPIVPEDASISLNNSVFGQVIRMKPGESAAQYGKVDTTPDISQDIAEAERLYSHAKRIIGISDAYMGISNSKNESGYAKQLQISQSSGRLESKKKMKHTAYAALDRIIFEYYLAFADEGRRLAYKDAYGRIHDAEFNRYDFLEYDIRTGTYYYDDAYLFSVDLNGGVSAQREMLWEQNLENLRSGALGDTTALSTLLRYWQAQERAHYPYARENVEYFRMTLEQQKKEGATTDEHHARTVYQNL